MCSRHINLQKSNKTILYKGGGGQEEENEIEIINEKL